MRMQQQATIATPRKEQQRLMDFLLVRRSLLLSTPHSHRPVDDRFSLWLCLCDGDLWIMPVSCSSSLGNKRPMDGMFILRFPSPRVYPIEWSLYPLDPEFTFPRMGTWELHESALLYQCTAIPLKSDAIPIFSNLNKGRAAF